MDTIIPVQIKNTSGNTKELTEVLEPERNPKVIYTDNSLEFGKACEDISLNHRTSTPHRSETNGIAERAERRIKEGISAVLLQSDLDENGGRIPWSAIFETFKISWLMGTRPMKDVIGWVLLSLRKTSQESINLERKSYLDCSSDTHSTRRELGRVTYWLQTLRSWRRWSHQITAFTVWKAVRKTI